MTYYEILRIKSTASDREIRAAYKQRVRTVHPDVGGSHEAFIQVQEAYATLSDPVKRAFYNLQLSTKNFQQAQQPKFRPPKFRPQFHVRFSVVYQTGLFGRHTYIEPRSLVQMLREAGVFYKGQSAEDVLKLIADTIEEMTQQK